MRDWEAVRASSDIQFAPLSPPPPPQTPEWLKQLQKFLEQLFEPLARALGLSWPVLEKILIALAVLAVLAIAWRILAPLWRARRAKPEAEQDWAPERGAALVLLEDADRLAAAGRFDEATHLLLQRSVGQIAEERPDWLHPASTAREITGLPGLPEAARSAFAIMAERVERSLFALRALGAEDWQAARAAYADFALAERELRS